MYICNIHIHLLHIHENICVYTAYRQADDDRWIDNLVTSEYHLILHPLYSQQNPLKMLFNLALIFFLQLFPEYKL